MYCIGIVDEDNSQVLDIQRTIIACKPESVAESSISFHVFEISGDADSLIENLYHEIVACIESKSIDSLLIDYKIIVSSIQIEGTDLYKRIKELVPRFPIILLTNLSESCYEKDYVDADKVYAKSEFFKIRDSVSKEKVFNLFHNIDNYKSNLSRIIAALYEKTENYQRNPTFDENLFEQLIKLDLELNDYLPQGQSQVSKTINLDNLREAVELLQEAKGLLGDK